MYIYYRKNTGEVAFTSDKKQEKCDLPFIEEDLTEEEKNEVSNIDYLSKISDNQLINKPKEKKAKKNKLVKEIKKAKTVEEIKSILLDIL